MHYLIILIAFTQTRQQDLLLHFAKGTVKLLIYVSEGLTATEGFNSPAGIDLNHFNDILTKPCAGASVFFSGISFGIYIFY